MTFYEQLKIDDTEVRLRKESSYYIWPTSQFAFVRMIVRICLTMAVWLLQCHKRHVLRAPDTERLMIQDLRNEKKYYNCTYLTVQLLGFSQCFGLILHTAVSHRNVLVRP
jgi:hypothetical protein